jgi:predicted Zn-dependent peptidase
MTQKARAGLHHGIPAYWLDGEGPCLGTLHFGVGRRDEPAVLAGINHLVEHLLLRMVQPQTVVHGGMTDTDSVELWANGEAAEVAEFLNAIAAAVCRFADVSKEDIALEKAIIEAEDPRAFSGVSAGLLVNRFGATDLGASHFGAPATGSLSKAELLTWAVQWFTAENTALTFTGQVPASLDVRLPAGRIPDRILPVPLVSSPTLIVSQKDGVALSLLVPAADSAILSGALRYELHHRLGHAQGLIYSVVDFQTRVDEDSVQLDLILDPASPNIIKAFAAGVAALQELARNGFSVDALAYARKDRAMELKYGRSVPDWHLGQMAVNGLRGRTSEPLKTASARLDALTAEGLTAALAEGMETLVVAVAGYAKPRRKHAAAHGLSLDRFEIWQDTAAAGPGGQGSWQAKSSDAELWLTADHLLRRSKGKTALIALADVVVVGHRSCGCVALMDSRGRSTEFDVAEWKKGKKLREALLQAFPAEKVRPFPED